MERERGVGMERVRMMKNVRDVDNYDNYLFRLVAEERIKRMNE